jgi:hypothetical protein
MCNTPLACEWELKGNLELQAASSTFKCGDDWLGESAVRMMVKLERDG